MESYSLLELNEHIRRVIALNFDTPLWVRCEISQAKGSRGHVYLDLVQKSEHSDEITAQTGGVIWSSKMRQIRKKHGAIADQVLQDGVEACVLAKVDYHERYGLKLVIEDIDPSYTIGNLEAQRREILERLSASDLIDLNSMIQLPLVPQRIAILSNDTAAGYQDFANHLRTNQWAYHFDTHLYSVALQGERVEKDVVTALQSVAKAHLHYDCVVIIRGGGSRIDLSGFDSYEIGKAIAECPLPVFTGIGHEIDESVADVVAHTALKTPTAVAEFIINLAAEFEDEIDQIHSGLEQTIRQMISTADLKLRDASSRLAYLPRQRLTAQQVGLDNLLPQLQQTVRMLLADKRRSIENIQSLTAALDPANVMKRGFSMTTKNGKVITTASQLQQGDSIETVFSDGSIESTVN